MMFSRGASTWNPLTLQYEGTPKARKLLQRLPHFTFVVAVHLCKYNQPGENSHAGADTIDRNSDVAEPFELLSPFPWGSRRPEAARLHGMW